MSGDEHGDGRGDGRRETPKFTGIVVHRDPRGRFAVRYPTGWRTFEIRSEAPLVAGAPEGAGDGAGAPEAGAPEGVAPREGIGFAPDPADPATVFTVWAAPLGAAVVAEDLEDLRAGVDEGLAGLPSCAVRESSEIVLGNLIRFERVYTFREADGGDGDTAAGPQRQRKQWLLYVDRWLICATWQGSSAGAYAYWFNMANQSFLTFEIPQALWFFTDRERLTAPTGPGREP